MATKKQFCTFFVDRMMFGVDVVRVQEVIRYQEITPVPLAPGVVSGLINLRGHIVTAIDLRRRLGLPPRGDGELPMNIVVQTSDGTVSFLVDAIDDVIEVDDSTFERSPETVPAATRELIAGIYKLDRRLLMVLDTDRALILAD